MQKKWTMKSAGDMTLAELDFHPVTNQLLAMRGITSRAQAEQFFNPPYSDLHDPFLFKNMRVAVDRIQKARKNDEHITIYGDYDADGIDGSATLAWCFRKLGIRFDTYLPHRETEGYGVNQKAIDYIIETNQSSLMITVDCGISNIEEVSHARARGLDVIITDHHAPREIIPDAIIVHPSVPGEPYPFKQLAGGGVAFKVVQALVKQEIDGETDDTVIREWESFEKWLIELPMISTIADLVPLKGENRVIAKYGLVVFDKTRNKGLQAVKDRSKITKADSTAIGFRVAPRINAAGRMDHASIAYELLMADNDSRASQLADELERNNASRRKQTQDIVDEATALIGDPEAYENPVVLALGHDWPHGLLGLIASRVQEIYKKPTYIMSKAQGHIVGSGRSPIPMYDCVSMLDSLKRYFEKYGGHPAACGFTLADTDLYLEFIEAVQENAHEQIGENDPTPILPIDLELDFKQIDTQLLDDLEKMEPFGKGNEKPIFISKQTQIIDCKTVGSDAKHLKLRVQDDNGYTFSAIAFGFGHVCDSLLASEKADIVYELGFNEWNGVKEIQMNIIDLKVN